MLNEKKVRISKDPDVRKQEILDAASALFISKGYGKTTVNDIINAVEIAKGTFYYYFKSKEEVMDAIVERFMDVGTAAALTVIDMDIPATEKLRLLITGGGENKTKEKMIEEFHEIDNAEMHLKSLVGTITRLAPLMGDIIEQGITEGSFKTVYSREASEFLLVASSFLFDEGIFGWTKEELAARARAFTDIGEQILGAEKGSLNYIYEWITR